MSKRRNRATNWRKCAWRDFELLTSPNQFRPPTINAHARPMGDPQTVNTHIPTIPTVVFEPSAAPQWDSLPQDANITNTDPNRIPSMAVQAKVLLVRNQLERLLYFATCHSTSNRLKVCIGHTPAGPFSRYLPFTYAEGVTGIEQSSLLPPRRGELVLAARPWLMFLDRLAGAPS